MSDFIIYILDYLDYNILRDVSIDELSQYFGYEKSYLMKRFKTEVGISIKTYINKVRIYRSLEMAKSNELLLKVALLNGFHSLEYYSETFTKVMGFPPSYLRKYNNLTKEELNQVKIGFMEEKRFQEAIHLLRTSKESGKVLRLEIPKEKKYVA